MNFVVIVAIINVVLLAAMAAVRTLLYNLIASLVGGQHVVVTDE